MNYTPNKYGVGKKPCYHGHVKETQANKGSQWCCLVDTHSEPKSLAQLSAKPCMWGWIIRVNKENCSSHSVRVSCLVLRFDTTLNERTQRKSDQLFRSARFPRLKSLGVILETRRSRRWLSSCLFFFRRPEGSAGGQVAIAYLGEGGLSLALSNVIFLVKNGMPHS